MREILFRGKRERDGKWVYGSLICDYDIDLYIIEGEEYILSGESEVRNPFSVIVDIKTVGQYIGLTDKNGTKIFEGDIVEDSGERYIVDWVNRYSRFAGTKPGVIAAILNFNRCDVIGNIHDNPELMKGECYNAKLGRRYAQGERYC